MLGDVHSGEGVGLAGLLLDAAQVHVGRGRRAIALLDPGRGLVAGGQEMRDAVTDRCDQALPVGGELDPAVVLGRSRDEGAAALERLHQALALQQVDGLAHGDAGDAELLLQLLERGDPGTDRPVAVADAAAQGGCHLQVARHAAVGVGPIEGSACAIGHADIL